MNIHITCIHIHTTNKHKYPKKTLTMPTKWREKKPHTHRASQQRQANNNRQPRVFLSSLIGPWMYLYVCCPSVLAVLVVAACRISSLQCHTTYTYTYTHIYVYRTYLCVQTANYDSILKFDPSLFLCSLLFCGINTNCCNIAYARDECMYLVSYECI